MVEIMAKSRTDYINSAVSDTQKYADAAAKKRNDAAAAYDKSLQDTYSNLIKDQKAVANEQIAAVDQDYQTGYDNAEIQAEINRRQIANNMANAGLTDSGLNRTQQTAVEIAKSNQQNAVTQQKNAAVSSLRQQLNDYIANINMTMAEKQANAYYEAGKANADSYENWMANAVSQGNSNFENDRTFNEKVREFDLDYETSRKEKEYERQKAQLDSLKNTLSTAWSEQYNAFHNDPTNEGKAFQYSAAQRSSIYNTIRQAQQTYGLSAAQVAELCRAAGITYNGYNAWVNG